AATAGPCAFLFFPPSASDGRLLRGSARRHAPLDCLIARCKVALLIASTRPDLVGRRVGPNPGYLFNTSLLVPGNNDVISPRTDLRGWLTHKLTQIDD